MLAACGSPPNPQAVAQTISDAEACGMGIIATAQGNVDVADLLKCGLTVADAYALVVKLLAANPSDAAAALAPQAQAYRARLVDLKAKLETLMRDGG